MNGTFHANVTGELPIVKFSRFVVVGRGICSREGIPC